MRRSNILMVRDLAEPVRQQCQSPPLWALSLLGWKVGTLCKHTAVAKHQLYLAQHIVHLLASSGVQQLRDNDVCEFLVEASVASHALVVELACEPLHTGLIVMVNPAQVANIKDLSSRSH